MNSRKKDKEFCLFGGDFEEICQVSGFFREILPLYEGIFAFFIPPFDRKNKLSATWKLDK